MKKKRNSSSIIIGFLILAALIMMGIQSFGGLFQTKNTNLKLSNNDELIQLIEQEKITSINIETHSGTANQYTYTYTGELVEGYKFDNNEYNTYSIVINDPSGAFRTRVDETIFKLSEIDTDGDIINTPTIIVTSGVVSQTNWLNIVIQSAFILIIIIVIFMAISQRSGGGKAMDVAKSKAKRSLIRTTKFKDVAGNDEEKQEMEEIIDFLKDPRKYNEIGAKIPKGVLLSGPPGTGKTLLAKAVAGEAHVPFFSIAGSEFVEMFVGVGASRVRNMFKVAQQNAPCIIFIDEIDAVGRQRGTGIGGGSDEREQTLNQLLTEMDGFGSNSGVIVIAATNRPDVLDPALLRPGRFDRHITVTAPDVRGREAILKVHARNKKIVKDLDFEGIASRTPGFSGAELSNVLNEAALLAARENKKVIELTDVDEAIDRVLLGPAKTSKVISKKEKRMVSFHEAGHAVIGIKLENANIVQKVTIIPRGQTGGFAMTIPKEERYLETKSSLTDKIVGLLGGRVSEELFIKEISTGAQNDFQRATAIARAMVTEYGMSDLGAVQYETPQSVFLGRDYQKNKNFSDNVAHQIDKEVKKIIENCYELAKEVLKENAELVANIAEYLLQVETLNRSDIYEIVETGKLAHWDEREIRREKKLKEEAEKKALEEAKKAETLQNETKETTNVESSETKEVPETKE